MNHRRAKGKQGNQREVTAVVQAEGVVKGNADGLGYVWGWPLLMVGTWRVSGRRIQEGS